MRTITVALGTITIAALLTGAGEASEWSGRGAPARTPRLPPAAGALTEHPWEKLRALYTSDFWQGTFSTLFWQREPGLPLI